MPDRATPPGLLWPSRAAETYLLLSRGGNAVLRNVTGYQERYAQARAQLIEALADERIKAVFLVSQDRSVRPLPGLFWSLPEQDKAWHGDYLSWSDQPQTQYWQLEEYPFGPLGLGFALVEKVSLLAHFDPKNDDALEIPWPHPGEYKTTYILRVMNLVPLRRIVMEETLPIAEAWLRARGKPHQEKDIRHQAKLMIALVGGLPKEK